MPTPSELLPSLLEDFVVAVGRGVAEAQMELDKSSLALQRAIDRDPVLAVHGLQATWYQIPRADLEFKVALAFSGTPQSARAPKVYLQSVNATYQNQFQYDATAASMLKLSVVPVPPRTSAELDRPPRLTEDEVLLAARNAAARAITDATVTSTRFDSLYRRWVVRFFHEQDGHPVTDATVTVLDQTGASSVRFRKGV